MVIDVIEEILKSQVIQIVEELIGEVVLKRCSVLDDFTPFGFEILQGDRCVKWGIVVALVRLILRRRL